MANNLDIIAKNYSEDLNFEEKLQKYKMLELKKFVCGKSMLDVGCGIGKTTKYLSKYFDKVVGIDGSKIKIDKANKVNSQKNITYILTMFEDFSPVEKFDMIICTNVLEHMSNSTKFLHLLKSWLSKRGRLIVTVPNARAFHKLLAVKMGLTNDLFKLTKADIGKGHFVIFDKTSLEKKFIETKFNIVYSGGILFKPFPNKLMGCVNDKVLDGLYEMGKDFPDICSSLVIVGENT